MLLERAHDNILTIFEVVSRDDRVEIHDSITEN
jgi:hypothetical protein